MNAIKTLEGMVELVKCSEEYSRLNNPDEITGRIFKRALNIGKKQGALEELEKIKNIIDVEGSWKGIVDYVKKRFKELEGKK